MNNQNGNENSVVGKMEKLFPKFIFYLVMPASVGGL